MNPDFGVRVKKCTIRQGAMEVTYFWGDGGTNGAAEATLNFRPWSCLMGWVFTYRGIVCATVTPDEVRQLFKELGKPRFSTAYIPEEQYKAFKSCHRETTSPAIE